MPSYDAELFEPPAPLAKVVLRTHDRQKMLSDVDMLIDSAADASLIPLSSAQQLKLEIQSDTDYTLTAFDGKESEARFVQCELVFLRRVFRGRFLVIEDATGILGRDVLNHFSLVLDGPNLNWRQEHTARDSEV